MQFSPQIRRRITRGGKRLCEKASGLGLSQASQHDADHSEVNPGFFEASEYLIVFGKPTPG